MPDFFKAQNDKVNCKPNLLFEQSIKYENNIRMSNANTRTFHIKRDLGQYCVLDTCALIIFQHYVPLHSVKI